MNTSDVRLLKILLIGDCKVGKTSLLLKYLVKNDENEKAKSGVTKSGEASSPPSATHGYRSEELDLSIYRPTTLSVYKCEVKINSENYKIAFTDPNGSWQNEKFAELRKKYYSIENNVDVILLCFSLVDRESLLNVTKKWYPEIRQYFNSVPILLIGTKCDLKQEYKQAARCKSSLVAKARNLSKKNLNEFEKLNESTAENTLTRNKDDHVDINHNLAVIEKESELDVTLASSCNATSSTDTENVAESLNMFNLVKKRDCYRLKRLLNAQKYLACSYLDDKLVKKTIDAAIKCALRFNEQKILNMTLSTSFSSFSSLTLTEADDTLDIFGSLKKSKESKAMQELQQLSPNWKKEHDTNRELQQSKKSQKSYMKCFNCNRSETAESICQPFC